MCINLTDKCMLIDYIERKLGTAWIKVSNMSASWSYDQESMVLNDVSFKVDKVRSFSVHLVLIVFMQLSVYLS